MEAGGRTDLVVGLSATTVKRRPGRWGSSLGVGGVWHTVAKRVAAKTHCPFPFTVVTSFDGICLIKLIVIRMMSFALMIPLAQSNNGGQERASFRQCGLGNAGRQRVICTMPLTIAVCRYTLNETAV